MRTKASILNVFAVLTGMLTILLAVFFAIPITESLDAVDLYVFNALAAVLVLFQGIFALRIVWNLEMRAGGGSIPYAWSLLSVQHLMFGFGGLLVAVFNRDYSYANGQGQFDWNRAVLPLLFVHAVSLNVGLLGVFVATNGSVGRKRSGGRDRRSTSHWNVWTWEHSRAICHVSLAMHAVVWMLLIPIHTNLPTFASYVIYGLAPTLTATYVLWGMSWGGCRSKAFFVVYTACFVLLEMLLGERGDGLCPLVLFGIGYIISPTGRRWNLRVAARWVPWAFPLVLAIYWISLSSEDMRHEFERGSLNGVADVASRLGSMLSGSSLDSVYYRIGSGDDVNGPFRLGSRLFELSAADVISRTPDVVPYWRWSTQDTMILLTGLLPLKLNPDATYNSDRNAGVLFLQSYGWDYVDPTKGNSMPATLVGDSWRRFGWAGVIVVFFCTYWAAAKVTLVLLSSPWGAATSVFSAALLAYNITMYDTEIIYLLDNTPRRLMITAVYVGLVYILSVLFGGVGLRAGGKVLHKAVILPPVSAGRVY